MKVHNAITSLSLEIINLADDEKEITGGYTGDLLSWVMSRASVGNAWITIMSNINILAVASLLDFSCIILAESAEVSEEVKKCAKEKGINLFRSGKSSFALCAELSRLM